MLEQYIYSLEPSVVDLYTSPLQITNGLKARLTNINRNNDGNIIYLKAKFTGRMYINVYRGYFDVDNILRYERSNHQLFTGTGDEETYEFQDFTLNKQKFSNYYIELEGVDSTSVNIYEMGLIFKDILSINSFSVGENCNLKSDINQIPLSTQDYDTITSFNLVVLNYHKDQVVNVIEQPFYLIFEDGDTCLDNTTVKLANRGISTNYITSHIQWIEMTLTNIEEIV